MFQKKRRVKDELKKRSYIEKYIPSVTEALKELLLFTDIEEKNIIEILEELLEKHRGEIENVEFDEKKNLEYDKEFNSIGKEDENE